MTDQKPTFVRAIYGRADTPEQAKEQYHHISDGAMNEMLAKWHAKQPERPYLIASPSTITTCPRVIYFKREGKEETNPMGWGLKQRLMLGRITEDLFAEQLKDEGMLLHHWKDGKDDPSQKFSMGEGLDKLEGTPDLLLKLGDKVAISDCKTSRSDSFGYVPLGDDIWDDWGWYKYRLQVTAYYMLCHANKESLNQIALKIVNASAAKFKEECPLLPEVCHLYSYALDNGVVHREMTWEPTQKDIDLVKKYTRRFNEAVKATEMPDCECNEFDTKFCRMGVPIPGKKVCEECCHAN